MNIGLNNLLPQAGDEKLVIPNPVYFREEGGGRFHFMPIEITPLVTIITVVFNDAFNLMKTIESVLAIKNESIEYIVIDGGSTDGTVELLRRYNDRIDYWLSEKDSGIYDAMNKGIEFARGDYVYHLNIGDVVHRIPVALLANLPPNYAGLAACVRVGDKDLHKPSAGLLLRLKNTIHHQGCFYRRKSDLIYDTQYRVYSDFDLNQRLIKSGQNFYLCCEIVAQHDQEGISNNPKYFKEVYKIIHKNYGFLWMIASFISFKFHGFINRLRS